MQHLLSRSVRDEYDRQLRLLPLFETPKKYISSLSYEDVLDVHFSIADFFFREGYGMGGVGIKDMNTFVSTVERQFTGYQGYEVYNSEYHKISTLVFGVIRNHPFHDGNKRTAFLCALYQLHRMGRVFTDKEKIFEDMMVKIADGSLSRKADVKLRIKRKENHPEINFLARYLEKHSRKTAKLRKTIKFRDLRNIVEANGFEFSNANKGTIDLAKTEERIIHRFWRSDKIEKERMVLLTIAYHGEGVDVPENTVKLVRQNCGLTEQDGFDGEVLLRDAQPTFQLITSYRSALQNLAYR